MLKKCKKLCNVWADRLSCPTFTSDTNNTVGTAIPNDESHRPDLCKLSIAEQQVLFLAFAKWITENDGCRLSAKRGGTNWKSTCKILE